MTPGSEAESAAGARADKSLAVLVVGMHRSGTSAVSGVLNKLGVAVPDTLHPADEHNARGYFEPQQIFSPTISFTVVAMAMIGGSDTVRGATGSGSCGRIRALGIPGCGGTWPRC